MAADEDCSLSVPRARMFRRNSLPAELLLDHSLQIAGKGPNDVQVIWEDSERALCRVLSPEHACLTSLLAVVPLEEHPSPASLDRLSHEFGLREELDSGWAVRPLKVEHDRGRTILVLEDP